MSSSAWPFGAGWRRCPPWKAAGALKTGGPAEVDASFMVALALDADQAMSLEAVQQLGTADEKTGLRARVGVVPQRARDLHDAIRWVHAQKRVAALLLVESNGGAVWRASPGVTACKGRMDEMLTQLGFVLRSATVASQQAADAARKAHRYPVEPVLEGARQQRVDVTFAVTLEASPLKDDVGMALVTAEVLGTRVGRSLGTAQDKRGFTCQEPDPFTAVACNEALCQRAAAGAVMEALVTASRTEGALPTVVLVMLSPPLSAAAVQTALRARLPKVQVEAGPPHADGRQTLRVQGGEVSAESVVEAMEGLKVGGRSVAIQGVDHLMVEAGVE
jgi:hypothetical protein